MAGHLSLPSASGSRWWRWLAWLLLALAALRLGQVLLHQPLAGYANQYDQVRAHACLGLWPVGAEPGASTPVAPLPLLRAGPFDPVNCHRTTDVLLAQLAFFGPRTGAWLAGVPAAEFTVSLRWPGVLKALLLAALVWLCDRLLREQPRARLLHALGVALVLSDPLNSLYLHSLYTEFGALLGTYALLAGLYGLTRAQGGRLALLLLGWGALALALSRFQHLPVLLALAALALWPEGPPGAPRRLRAVLLGSALALGIASHHDAQLRLPNIPAANRADTLFGALLPASSDPQGLVARLGLPAACADLGGSNWYLPRGHDLQAACPAAFRVSHARIAWALLAEPLTALRALAIAVPQSTAWRLNYVGELAGEVQQRAPVYSLSDAFAGGPLGLHWLFWCLPLLAGLLALPACLRRRSDPLPLLQLGCALTVAGGWAASVFGDGYSELPRHLHLAVNAGLLGWLLWLAAWFGRDRRLAGWTLLLTAGLSQAGLLLPATHARLTQPATDQLSAGAPQPVQGWVLAPGPRPAAVELCTLSTCTRVPLTADPAVGAFFPVQGGAAAWRFATTMPLTAGPLEVWLLLPAQSRIRVLRHSLIAQPP